MKEIFNNGFVLKHNEVMTALAHRVIGDQREIVKDPHWVSLLTCDCPPGQEYGLFVHSSTETNEHGQPRDQKIKFEFNKQAYGVITRKHLPPFLRQHIERVARLYEENVRYVKLALRVLDADTKGRFSLYSKFCTALTRDLHLLRIVVYLGANDKGELAKVHCDQSMITCVDATTHPGLFLNIKGVPIPFHGGTNEVLFFPGMKGSLETGGRRDVRVNCRGNAVILATKGGSLEAVEHWAEQPPGLSEGEYRGTAVFFGHSVRSIAPLSQQEIDAVQVLS